MKFSYPFIAVASLLAVTSCANSTITPAQVATVAADVTAIVTDIQAATAGKPLTQQQLATVASATSQLSTDVAALNAGTTGTTVATVLADVTKAAQLVGPFLPEIEALVALAAPPGAAPPTMAQAHAMADYARLKADARVAGG
jgi:hypothetical protein